MLYGIKTHKGDIMSYKNSLKLLTNNFSVVWKQLLYILAIILIIAPITYGVSSPIIDLLKSEGVVSEFGLIFETIYTQPSEVITAISTACLHLGSVILGNFGSIWLSLFATFLVCVVVYGLLKDISNYNISSVMYMQMTSYVSIGYTRNLISTLGQSIRFSFVKMLCKIPFAILKLLVLYAYFRIVNNWLTIIIGLFVVTLILVFLFSVEICFFSGFAGKMLDLNGNISAFKALGQGMSITFKNFARVLANAVIVVLTITFVNLFLGVFTLGVALLITIPASMVFVCIFELTTYFNCKGDRYYLTSTILATPVKGDNEKIKD